MTASALNSNPSKTSRDVSSSSASPLGISDTSSPKCRPSVPPKSSSLNSDLSWGRSEEWVLALV